MTTDSPAAEIQQEMLRVRRRLDCDVQETVAGAQQLTDWKYYLKNYPWHVCGAAAAIGYLAVSRPTRIVSPDAESLERLAKRNRLVVQQQPQPERSTSLAQSAGRLVGHMVLRAAVAWAGQQLGKVVGNEAAEVTESETSSA